MATNPYGNPLRDRRGFRNAERFAVYTIPMQCPICRKEVAITDEFMPFCSDRCRLIDLGNWASEKYVISTPVDPQSLEDRDE